MMKAARLRFAAAVAAAVLLLAACGSSAKQASPNPVPPTTTPTTTSPGPTAPPGPTPSTTTSPTSAPSPTSTAVAGAATSVLYAAPVDTAGRQLSSVTVTGSATGTCNSGSDAIGNVPVYRCFSGNGVYDPCWALTGAGQGSSNPVLCQSDPWSTSVFRITAPGAEPGGAATPADPDYPWAVTLTDGTHCLAAQGAHDSFDGKTVEYYCPGGVELVGYANRAGAEWTFPTADQQGSSLVAGPTVRVSTAWFAGPDPTTVPVCTGAELAASAGSGSAGAGHIGSVLLFRNSGAALCTLTGYPGVAGLDAAGNQVVQAQRTLSGYLGGLTPGTATPLIVELAPGQTASAVVEGTDVPAGNAASCPSYPALLVTAPGTTTSVRLGVTLPGCSTPQVHPVVFGTTGSDS